MTDQVGSSDTTNKSKVSIKLSTKIDTVNVLLESDISNHEAIQNESVDVPYTPVSNTEMTIPSERTGSTTADAFVYFANNNLGVQPEVMARIRAEEQEAQKLQEGGYVFFVIVWFFTILINGLLLTGFLLKINNLPWSITFASLAFVSNLSAVLVLFYFVYINREFKPIKVRGFEYLLALFISAIWTVTFMFLVCLTYIGFGYSEELESVALQSVQGPEQIFVYVCFILSGLGFSAFQLVIVARHRLIYLLFKKNKVYQGRELAKQFWLPIIAGVIFYFLFDVSFFLAGYLTGGINHPPTLIYVGDMLCYTLYIVIALYYIFKTKDISSFFSDWYQNFRNILIFGVATYTYLLLLTFKNSIQVASTMMFLVQPTIVAYLYDCFFIVLLHKYFPKRVDKLNAFFRRTKKILRRP